MLLNDQTPGKSASKKRKRESRGEQDLSAENESVSQPSTAFVPFNYSDVDYSTFTGKNVQQEMKSPLKINRPKKHLLSISHVMRGVITVLFSMNCEFNLCI